MSVATDVRAVGSSAALAIGGTVALEAIFAGHISGASMNPARSFGPAIVGNVWADFWIYILGPAIGAIAMSIVWQIWKTIGDDNLEEDAA